VDGAAEKIEGTNDHQGDKTDRMDDDGKSLGFG
jgi:hypothetical protein